MNDHETKNTEERLRKWKPKINRDIRSEILAEVPRISTPPKKRKDWAGYLFACTCSFLFGLFVMYGVMKPVDAVAPRQEASPQRNENQSSPFVTEQYAAKPPEKRQDRPVRAGNEYAYYYLMKQYQQ